jgi:hypothetical protein
MPSEFEMSKYDDYKFIIFDTEEKKERLVQAIISRGYAAEHFEDAYKRLFVKVNEADIQKILAPFLRELAIHQLRNSDTPHCKHFRNSFPRSDYPDMDVFLQRQQRNYVWAGADEAVALAEVFGLNLIMTYTQRDVEGNHLPMEGWEPHYCHQASPAANDSVHLYFSPGVHYFVYHNGYSQTIGDGNCLYNGFAQHLQQFIAFESNHTQYLEHCDEEIFKIIISQQKAYNKLVALNNEPLSYEALLELNQLLQNNREMKGICIEEISQDIPASSKTKSCAIGGMETEKNAKEVNSEKHVAAIKEQLLPICHEILTSRNGLLSILLGAVIAVVVSLVTILTSALSGTVGIGTGLASGACVAVCSFFAARSEEHNAPQAPKIDEVAVDSLNL